MRQALVLNFQSPCLSLLSARIPGVHQKAQSYEEVIPWGLPWLKGQQEVRVKETAFYKREGQDAMSLREQSSEMPEGRKAGRLSEDSNCQPPKFSLFCTDGSRFWSPQAAGGKMGVELGSQL